MFYFGTNKTLNLSLWAEEGVGEPAPCGREGACYLLKLFLPTFAADTGGERGNSTLCTRTDIYCVQQGKTILTICLSETRIGKYSLF
jgi:hypothetical protein